MYKPYKLAVRIAASLLILLVAGIAIYKHFLPTPSPTISLTAGNTVREITLPDHSQVTLSRNTTITYTKYFGNTSRHINLSGEAFFKITPDTEKPFIVHTPIANIQVVGTSFHAALQNDHFEVGVTEGKVMVYTDHDSSYLTPGHSAIVNAATPAIIITPSDPNTWGYATGKFAFKNVPLKEVFRYIEKTYPCSIKVHTKTIENCKLTAIFENASAENMLSLIAETLDLTVTKNDHTFILQGKGCP